MTVARERVKGEKTVSPFTIPAVPQRNRCCALRSPPDPQPAVGSTRRPVSIRLWPPSWRPALVFGSPVRRFQRAPGHRCEFYAFSSVFVAVGLSDVAGISPVFYHLQRSGSCRFPAGLPPGGGAHQGNLAGTQARIQDWPPGRRPEGVSRQGRRVAPGPPDEAGVERTAQRQVSSAMPGVMGASETPPCRSHATDRKTIRVFTVNGTAH